MLELKPIYWTRRTLRFVMLVAIALLPTGAPATVTDVFQTTVDGVLAAATLAVGSTLFPGRALAEALLPARPGGSFYTADMQPLFPTVSSRMSGNLI